MDVINISRSRRFLRERPIHVNLFDRPRLVVDLLCLEPEQEESRRGFDRSDSLLVLIEGEARLHAGSQIESLQEMDAVLVPPGLEYQLTNTGAGQLTAMVILSPKPTRTDEVRVPGDARPFRNVRPDGYEARPAGERRPAARPYNGNGRPQRDRPYPPRDEGERRAPYPRREAGANRPAYPRGDGPARGDGPPRGEGGRSPRREAGPARPAYPRTDGPSRDAGGRFPPRGDGASRPAYPRRDGPRSNDGPPRDATGRFVRSRPGNRDEAGGGERGGPRRGSTGARAPRRDEGDGPVWYPKSKAAWRPRGAPPAGGGRSRPVGTRGTQGAPRGRAGDPGATGRTTRSFDGRGGTAQPRGAAASGEGSGGAGARNARPTGPRDSRGGAGSSRPPGANPRGRGGPKTGDARRASRGQGPLSGRRGPGRSGPRTSGPPRSPA